TGNEPRTPFGEHHHVAAAHGREADHGPLRFGPSCGRIEKGAKRDTILRRDELGEGIPLSGWYAGPPALDETHEYAGGVSLEEIGTQRPGEQAREGLHGGFVLRPGLSGAG